MNQFSHAITALFLIFSISSSVFAQKEYKVGVMGFWNLENLFDTERDTSIYDEEFTPEGVKFWNEEKYQKKLDNLSKVIHELGTDYNPIDGIAALGVSEVENRKVLEDLVAHPTLADRNYQIVHEESPDERGIDVGFLYNPKYFQYLGHEAREVILWRKDGTRDFTRDILHVYGVFDTDTIHFLVNHWPSRSGGQAASAHKRNEAARVCKTITDSILAINPHANIIITGDFNDDPTSESVIDVLGAKIKERRVKAGDLYNAHYDYYKKGIGTLAWRDSWNLFDQMILSYGLLDKNQEGYRMFKVIIHNKPYLISKSGRFKGYPFRTFNFDLFQNGYSDHLPVYCVFVKPID